MLAVVKTPHTEFTLQGDIPEKYLDMLRSDFGDSLMISNTAEDETVDVFGTDWYQEAAENSPAEALRFYRKLHNLTQKKVADELEIAVQTVSNMETSVRPISRSMAKLLGKYFEVPAGRFI